MRKYFYKLPLVSLLLLSLLWPQTVLPADNLATKLKGRILLQVEGHGEAWYLNPDNLTRYFLGRPADAFKLMRQLGLGINNRDFAAFENRFPARLSGRIVIKAEDGGKAYYIAPQTLKPHFLGRPADAFNLMRQLGLGIRNDDLNKIPLALTQESSLPSEMETAIHQLINRERASHGLSALKWNDVVAAVAREHSENQAAQNRALINSTKVCSFPFIHHEGIDFGINHSQRLNSRNIHYFSASAENIALIPQIKEAFYRGNGETSTDCPSLLAQLNKTYDRAKETLSDQAKIDLVKAENAKRQKLTEASETISLTKVSYHEPSELETTAVNGWMNSPGHRKNILNGEYDEAGVGIAQVNDYLIITQVFIKKAECGYKNGPCCEKPGFYPYCYVPLSCKQNLCQ